MADISSFSDLALWAVALVTLLETRRARKEGLSSEHQKILGDVIEAAEKTQTYLLKRESGGARDLDTEWELAEKWSRLSYSVRSIDRNLSERLHLKSRIWRDRQEWEQGIRATKELSLDSVISSAYALR